MQTNTSTFDTKGISADIVLNLIGDLLGKQGYPALGNRQPEPSGPWDRYILNGLEELLHFGPSPEPWQYPYLNIMPSYMLNQVFFQIYSAQGSFDGRSPLSRQLPPRSLLVAIITQQVINQTFLMQDIADAMHQKEGERSIIIVSGLVDRFLDAFEELCPRIIFLLKKHPNGPWGGDVPHPNWDNDHFNGIELYTAAAVLYQNAARAGNETLRLSLQEAGVKLTELGGARM